MLPISPTSPISPQDENKLFQNSLGVGISISKLFDNDEEVTSTVPPTPSSINRVRSNSNTSVKDILNGKDSLHT